MEEVPSEADQNAIAWIVGLLAMVISFAVMISPIRKVLELRSGSGVPQQTISILVYLAMFANYLVWTWYGVVHKNPIVFVQNGAGLLLTAFYLYRFGTLSVGAAGVRTPGGTPSATSSASVVLHPAWLSQPSRVNLAALVLLLVFSVLGVLTMQHVIISTVINVICVVMSILLFASPLSSLKLVLLQKHTGNLDMVMSLLLFAMACAWTLYGFLIGDINIAIPNVLGVVLSIAQLSLFAIYPRKRKEEPLFL